MLKLLSGAGLHMKDVRFSVVGTESSFASCKVLAASGVGVRSIGNVKAAQASTLDRYYEAIKARLCSWASEHKPLATV